MTSWIPSELILFCPTVKFDPKSGPWFGLQKFIFIRYRQKALELIEESFCLTSF